MPLSVAGRVVRFYTGMFAHIFPWGDAHSLFEYLGKIQSVVKTAEGSDGLHAGVAVFHQCKGVVQADDVQILPYAHLELLFEGGG